MKIKKIVGVCAAFVAAALMTVAAHAATYSTTTSVSGSDPNKVATLTVKATPSSASETVSGVAIKVFSDKAVLTPKNAGKDAASEDTYVTAKTALDGGVVIGDKVDSGDQAYIAFAWAKSSTITLTGETDLATIDFDVTSGATGTTDVTVEIVQVATNATTIAGASANSGEAETVTLTATFALGDVTLDGNVDGDDATELIYSLLNKVTLDATQQLVADVDGSGSVDGNDVTGIIYHILGKSTIGA